MHRIVPDIQTLEQHFARLFGDPQYYRPEACPTCGLADPWAHGSYTRKADRQAAGEGRRQLIPIPRFICRNPECRRTCSRLPACIAPRRWYLWALQQTVLLHLLTGRSLSAVAGDFAAGCGPVRSTLRRWQSWLEGAPARWVFHLKSRFAQLARYGDGTPFWVATVRALGLAEAMTALDAQGECAP
jgi:hypothetical protein